MLSRWLALHILVGATLANLSTVDAQTAARTIALPSAAILVGLAFGWAGRSAGLLQDKSFSAFLIKHGPSPEGYVYAFQLAILTVLIFIGVSFLIIVGGVGVTLGSPKLDDFVNSMIMFTMGSIALRESWGVIYFVNKLTIQYYRVREVELSEAIERRE